MDQKDALKDYFLRVIEGLKTDAASKNQKIPVSSFTFEVDNLGGQLWAADYFKYLVLGRGPGKAPPPDKMTAFVEANPELLENARAAFKNITAKGLGYIIGQKIAREGTDIFQGKKPGIDFIGVMDANQEKLIEDLAMAELSKIETALKTVIRK